MILFPDLLPQPLPEPEDDEKPITRKNLMLRCVFSFILIIFLAIIGTIVVIMSPLANLAPFNSNLEWHILEVPNDLSSSEPFKIPRKLKIPKGFGIEVYAQVPSARFLLTLPDNKILVSQPNLGLVTLLQPSSSFERSATSSIFASNLDLPNDMLFYKDVDGNSYIYIAQNTKIVRYLYEKSQTKIGFAEVIVDDLPGYFPGYLHPYKGIAIGNGSLYVSIGSSSNMNPNDLKSEPKRGAIYAYKLDTGQRRLVTQGIRHAEGMDFQPDTNNLWAVSGQSKNIKYPYKEYYGQYVEEFAQNNPLDGFVQIIENLNFGWPYCNPMPSFELPVPYIPDYDNNRNESIFNCSSFRKIDLGLAAHSNPLGLTFWTGDNAPNHYHGIAVIALHDNFKDGHRVIHVPWNPKRRPQFFKDLVVGWASESDNTRWGQPVDTAIMQDGSLLISEDLYGVIYRLYEKT